MSAVFPAGVNICKSFVDVVYVTDGSKLASSPNLPLLLINITYPFPCVILLVPYNTYAATMFLYKSQCVLTQSSTANQI